MVDRMIVFVDWQNLYSGARRAFHDGRGDGVLGQVRPGALGELIAARGGPRGERELEQVRVYRGFPSEAQNEVGHAAARAQREAWERHPKVAVFPHTLQRKTHTCQRCGEVQKFLNEKGVDVNLAIDLINLAHQGAYDVGVVFSTDTDFNPAIELGLALGVKVENAVWWTDVPHGNRPLLFGEIWHHRLWQEDYERVRDNTLYVPDWARGASRP